MLRWDLIAGCSRTLVPQSIEYLGQSCTNPFTIVAQSSEADMAFELRIKEVNLTSHKSVVWIESVLRENAEGKRVLGFTLLSIEDQPPEVAMETANRLLLEKLLLPQPH